MFSKLLNKILSKIFNKNSLIDDLFEQSGYVKASVIMPTSTENNMVSFECQDNVLPFRRKR
jgi:hypothetical protein